MAAEKVFEVLKDHTFSEGIAIWLALIVYSFRGMVSLRTSGITFRSALPWAINIIIVGFVVYLHCRRI